LPFDSSGNFTRNTSWQAEAAAGTKILASNHDSHDTDLANALSLMICKSGISAITADIPWGNHKITNLKDPDDPQDAATRKFVEEARTFATGMVISGTNTNGRLVFSGPSGVNGISWTAADLFWGGRMAVANQSPNRLVLNDTVDASGTDVISIDEIGVIGAPSQVSLTANAYRVGANWRTPVAGRGSLFQMSAGSFFFYTNPTVTAGAYDIATMHGYLSAVGSDGNTSLLLNKTASGKVCDIVGQMAGKSRWLMRLGDGTAESGANVGSNFALYAYDDAGTVSSLAMSISRTNRTMITGGDILVAGITFGGFGYRTRAGTTAGSYGADQFNFYWTGSQLRAYVGSTDLGNVLNTCDYRIKRNVEPLDSTWNRVKALRPISYVQADLTLGETQVSVADDIERWGFLAHELQEGLLPTAADGEKDAPNAIQSVNTVAVIAALTKALQEAMARIEVLEGKA
jgi:hypothetical protein